MKSCLAHGIEVNNLKVGDKLDASPEYVENAFQVINEVAIKLTHVLWRKVLPKERKNADDELISLSFELLQEEEYELAINILDLFVNTIKKFHDSTYKRIAVVNLAIAYKFSGDKDNCNKELSKLDWTDAGYDFKISQAVLISLHTSFY